MASNAERIEKWVRKQLTDPSITNDGERKVLAFAVMHTTVGVAKEVETFKLGSKPIEPKQIAERLSGIIDDHAEGISREESGSHVEQYEIKTFFSDLPDHPQGCLTVSRKTAMALMPSAESGSSASEPPTPQGMARQDMRQKEGWMQFTLEMVARTYSAQVNIINALSARNAKLEDENYDAVELAKEMILEKAAIQGNNQIALEEAKLKGEQWKKILELGPHIVNRVAGREILPTEVANASMFKAIVADLVKANEKDTQALLMTLQRVLSPENMAVVVGMLLDEQEKVNARVAAEAAKNVTATPNGRPS
jgi:hypothetical protein